MPALAPQYFPSPIDLEKGIATPQSIAMVSAQLEQIAQTLAALTPTVDSIAIKVGV